MLLVPTYLDTSGIHGMGLFAGARIREGTVYWRFDSRVDILVPLELVERLPREAVDYIRYYGFQSSFWPGTYVLNGDNARFMNHSEDANTDNRSELGIAKRDIAAGEELTCDYREVEGFLELL